ncbi:hypothetical protein ACFQFH_05840 [Halobaculum halobium]|uniref:PGF-CTERM protein n=1 Tax=Halobaculum halobium TaxID=3032281 RepID=A0ABD5TDF3_9EURY|nr:hypothetical protein [Halobaculum sp. SYNS20]
MADITMFELHFHESLGLGGVGSDGGPAIDSEATEEPDAGADEDASSGPGIGGVVAGLVAVALLVLLGVGVKKLLSDDLDPIEELENLDEES